MAYWYIWCIGALNYVWFLLPKVYCKNNGKEKKQHWHVGGVRKGAALHYNDPLKEDNVIEDPLKMEGGL